jgi:uncharacterized protein (DUF1810 family)
MMEEEILKGGKKNSWLWIRVASLRQKKSQLFPLVRRYAIKELKKS